MFHMLSCFDLANDVSIDDFNKSNSVFIRHLQDLNLVASASPVGRRNRHPIMDTDKERDQEYFYLMTFVDESQCNRAVEYIQSRREPATSIHVDVLSKTRNQIFICWQDILFVDS